MTSPNWLDWLSQYWKIVIGLLSLLVGAGILPAFLKWQEKEAKRERLVAEADHMVGRASRRLEVSSSFWDKDAKYEQMDPEQIILDAVVKYREAIKLTCSKKEKAKLCWRVGRAYSQIKWWDFAEEFYLKAVRYCKKHEIAWRDLAEVQRPYKPKEAVKNLQQHLRYNPDDDQARRLLEEWTQPKPAQLVEAITEIPL